MRITSLLIQLDIKSVCGATLTHQSEHDTGAPSYPWGWLSDWDWIGYAATDEFSGGKNKRWSSTVGEAERRTPDHD